MRFSSSLGTQLRHLLEMLDGDVQRAYELAGLDYRPRYTPVVRVLRSAGASSIRSIATRSGLTHSAVSQTVALMAKAELVTFASGRDDRERIVTPTPKLIEMLPDVERRWAATSAAAAALDGELPYSLSRLIAEAVAALEAKPFSERIAAHSSMHKSAPC